MTDFRCARPRKEASFRLAVRLVGRMGRLKGRMVGEERVDFHLGRVEAGGAVDAAGLTQETPPPPFGMSGGGGVGSLAALISLA